MILTFELIMVFLVLIFLLFVIIVRYKDIASFIHPENWSRIIMFESDNNISEWLEKKNPDLRFEFNKGLYNMFESSEKIDNFENGRRIVHGGTCIYRTGRLACLVYVEGNENPVDLRNLKITGNPQLNKQLLKLDISKLFMDSNSSMDNFLRKVLPILIFVGIVIVILILLSKGNAQPVPAQPTIAGG